MKVLNVADLGEVEAALFETIRTPGPVYLFLGRGIGGIIHSDLEQIKYDIGQPEVLRNEKDVTIIVAGIMM